MIRPLINLSALWSSYAVLMAALAFGSHAHARDAKWEQMYGEVAKLYQEGRIQDAVGPALRALTYAEATFGKEHVTTSSSLNNLALLYQNLIQYDKALPLYLRALAIAEETQGPTHASTGTCLHNLAALYREMAQYDKALPLLLRSLTIAEKTQGLDHPVTAIRLNDLGELYQRMARYDKALPNLQRALAIAEHKLGPDHPRTGTYLNNLSLLYKDMAQYDKALPLSQRALAIAEKVGGPDDRVVGIRLNNLALLYEALGLYAKALPLLERAVIIAESTQGSDHPETGVHLSNLAWLHLDLAQYAKALPLMQRALAIAESTQGPDHPVTGNRLNMLAYLYQGLNQFDKALPLAQRSYLSAIAGGHILQRFDATSAIARSLYLMGKPDAAILYAKQAVNLWQTVRSQSAAGLSAEQSRGLLEANKNIYTDLADWLVASGRLAEAEQVMSMLKNEELIGLVRRSGAGAQQAALDSIESKAVRELEVLSASWLGKANELATLEKLRSSERSPEQTDRLRNLRAEREQWQAKLQKWMAQLQNQLAASPADAQARRDQLGRTGSSMQALVAATPGAALGLQYVLTDQRLSIIVHTASASAARQVSVPITQLRAQVARLRSVLDDPRMDPRPAAQALYQTLIGPVAAEVAQAAPQTLILNLDDVLRYVPFAALHDGNQYLVERMAIAVHTSAGGASIRAQSGVQWQVGALGLTQAQGRFAALPSVGTELRAIVRTRDNAAGLMPGVMALDGQFNEDMFRDVLKDQMAVLHIATHFNFQAGSEYGSFLLLGDGKELPLASIKTMNFNGVQLLTLSACETAKGGGRTGEGEEVEGLAAIVQQKGAQAVLATLWPVADASTASLMREFYRLRIRGDSPGSARDLRTAQLAMLRGALTRTAGPAARGATAQRQAGLSGEPTFSSDPTKPYAHPYYWAPFTLMGNWL